ncbi:nuclear transport factor 2 family protein [Rhodococcus sp. IEGM 1381]|uniref:nuclear transport factor 2 family protein n=1 Tax=Rhodococcus sp. IEGM 1381 TaxID=3047085 RepID=UPI0024B85F31|nr:nuclear transport factor 2 family protein [Rhodococcus sp. IEGM 1381]MDI9896131.1 nuclear transport factor 2 family protein [Rhodococcus sp. IEGM 1381]
MNAVEIAARLDRIESRSAIQELPIVYCLVMDERNLDGIRAIFSETATMRSIDGVFTAEGREEIVETFQRRFDSLGPTHHFTHGHIVRFDDRDPDLAYGSLGGHAELVRNSVPMVAALRYRDIYRRYDGIWQFEDRLMSYMYYLPVGEYEAGLGDSKSMRAYGDHRSADWPDALHDGDGSWLARYFPIPTPGGTP